MSQSLKDKITVITGGSRGIGASVATLFAREGAKVVICSTSQDVLEDKAEAIKKETGNTNILAIKADVSVEEDVKHLFEQTKQHFGPCDILINNAAVISINLIEDTNAEILSKLMNVNVIGTLLCSKHAFISMKENGGTIINVSSIAGVKGVEKFPGTSAYVASKFAVIGLTEALAVEGRPLNIRVNCIAPGAVDTSMLRKAFPDFTPTTTPSDISQTFLFLADTNKSRKITGEIIEIHCNN
ncbi:hypothetical protein DID80_01545 [Candidatus Marinamargulisbacteria bacterium SCGC AAA071-K20]|nr:hypothetical protein DID80_01545 [Candidatus Marinamargulisbacteria bacterium SCGC AAA071-K20]